MKHNHTIPKLVGAMLATLFVLLLMNSAHAQQIILDKPVKAGELTLFPAVSDPNTYYFVSDKARLAQHPDGTPQFSFLRYVRNIGPTGGASGITEGEGGGIVHAVVSLAVTEDQLREARQQLRRLRPDARIEGPVIYSSGKFALVTSFNNENNELTKQVVGVGNAPILDGQKAAVSIQLTKLGSKLLWESFHTATPDISFSFEMTLDGYNAPKRALLEAHFDQIYEHQSFAAGLASEYLQAEINGAFDDLRKSGAIKLTQVGADENMDALITTAYNKITEMMFQPIDGTGTPSLASLTGAAGGSGPSVLDRASQMLTDGQRRADQQNAEIRRENTEERQRFAREQEARRQRRAAAATPTRSAETTPTPETGGETNIETAIGSTAGTLPPQRTDFDPDREFGDDVDRASEPQLREEVSAPAFAIAAVFSMKKVRQRGDFTIDLNKFTADSLTMRFDENVGDLRDFLQNENIFRAVNLDDPLYKQREITVALDGFNAQNFGTFVNYVSVLIRKKHQNGESTEQEIRIDRDNFNKEGNNFRTLYGFKGDTDRDAWLTYEYKTAWSLIGNRSVETPWQTRDIGSINLYPPYQIRTIDLEGDPNVLKDAGVRLATVKIFYKINGDEVTAQESLQTTKEPFSKRVQFLQPPTELQYDYVIDWRKRGETVSSGRKTSTDSILFVDEIPGT